MDVSIVEFLWVFSNAVGLGAAFFCIYDAQFDYRHAGSEQSRLASRSNLRNESFKVILYMFFMLVGVIEFFEPDEPFKIEDLKTVVLLFIPIYYGIWGSFRNRSDRRSMDLLMAEGNDNERQIRQDHREGGQNIREGEQNLREEEQNVRDRASGRWDRLRGKRKEQ